ncbi:hypothetical protein [Thiobacter aerophilum]|uniref:Uncharacterized protein n=1 Tax=Thiobacter aerophilum TaxID=3121275 RepID=A0ABV0EBY4_9BURK
MPEDTLVCVRCGAALDDLPLPLSRLAQCPACRAPLHTCRMCRFYDPSAARQCLEPVAEEVRDKDQANFCGYFQPRLGAFTPRPDTAAARAALDALFGAASPAPTRPNPLDELFGKD